MTDFAREEDIQRILKTTKTFAVVGLSRKTHRPSRRVGAYLKSKGYRVIPVNPNYQEIFGEKSYPNLSAVPDPFETVQVFRKPKYIPDIVEEVIQLQVKNLWLQEGVIHEEAAQKARDAGVRVVMDRCAYKEHARLF